MEKKEVSPQEQLATAIQVNDIAEIVQSNEQILDIDGVEYRIKKANYKQKREAYQKRVEKFNELLRDMKFMLESDLKKVYLTRGIDINAMDVTLKNKSNRRDTLKFQLGELLTKMAPDSDLVPFTEELEVLESDIQNLSLHKTTLLEVSIEQQVMIYTLTYLTFLIVEKKIPGKDLGEGNKDPDTWERAWKTWEDFEAEPNEKVINRCTYFVTLMSSGSEL